MLNRDRSFQSRLSGVAERSFRGLFLFSFFTDPGAACSAAAEETPDLFVSEPGFGILPEMLPRGTLLLRLSEGNDKPDLHSVSKYEGADVILRYFLRLISEGRKGAGAGTRPGGRLVIFSTPCGGSGSSSLCEAFGIRESAKRYKKEDVRQESLPEGRETRSPDCALLNLECCRSPESLGYGQKSGLSALILAVKNRRGDLSGMIRSAVFPADGACGLFVTGPPDYPEDTDGMTPEERLVLVRGFLSEFGTVLLDIPFSLCEGNLRLFDAADRIIMTSAADESAVLRINLALGALGRLDRIRKSGNLEKVRVIIRGEKADLPVEIASGSVGFAEMIEKEGVGTISQRLSEKKEGWYEIATG